MTPDVHYDSLSALIQNKFYPLNAVRKNGFGYFVRMLLATVMACTSADSQRQAVETPTPNPCRQIIWQDANTNRYVYDFDDQQRLHQCTALEETSGYGTYVLNQQLTYTRQGWLERVRGQEDSSQYVYQKGRLASINFFQEGQPVYRYLVDTNDRGQLVGLQGIPLNNSGLQSYSTRYQLDAEGRYVQLEVFNELGKLYYRVIQRDFVVTPNELARDMTGIPYDLNRYPWPRWGEQFPLSKHQAGHIEMYRYAAPQSPTQLLKRAEVSVTFQRDRRGYITSQISTDALTTIQDTVHIMHLNCL